MRASKKSQPTAAYDPTSHMVSEQDALRFSVGRKSHPADTIVRMGNLRIGGKKPFIIAGPCAVDDTASFVRTVKFLADQGVTLIRANLFKFRTLPTSFQGLGEDGLSFLANTKKRFNVKFVIEVMDQNQVEVLAPVADVYQVGARSMASTSLLKKLAKIDRPVLLKRNCASTLGEFLAAAEYLVSGGNERVILCERGVRSFDNWMRFSLDIPGIALLRQVCHLPVIADISHSLGRVDLAGPVAAAALAAGANGLMMEVHASPNRALSDASQQLTPRQFSSLLGHLKINLKKRPKR